MIVDFALCSPSMPTLHFHYLMYDHRIHFTVMYVMLQTVGQITIGHYKLGGHYVCCFQSRMQVFASSETHLNE